MSDPSMPGASPPAASTPPAPPTADAPHASTGSVPHIAAGKLTINQRIAKWLPIIAGIVVAIVGASKLIENFTLPSCESTRSLDTIKSIFKDKNLPEPTLTGAQSVASSSSEKTCKTNYEIPNETGSLDYKVFWDGWSAKVMITKVNP